MGLFFEMLANFFGGMLTQLQQDGRIGLTRFFVLCWISLFVCFVGMFIFDGPFKRSDLFLAAFASMLTTAICWALMKYRYVKLNRKVENLNLIDS